MQLRGAVWCVEIEKLNVAAELGCCCCGKNAAQLKKNLPRYVHGKFSVLTRSSSTMIRATSHSRQGVIHLLRLGVTHTHTGAVYGPNGMQRWGGERVCELPAGSTRRRADPQVSGAGFAVRPKQNSDRIRRTTVVVRDTINSTRYLIRTRTVINSIMLLFAAAGNNKRGKFSVARRTPHGVVRRCRHAYRGGLDRQTAQSRGGGRVWRGIRRGLQESVCSAT